MRNKVLLLALTSMLMLLCIPLCAQEVVIAHIDDREEYVDLGLSVKWATCNVGAANPEEVGGLFAWGETTTKTEYSYSTYKYSVDGVRGNYMPVVYVSFPK